MKNRIISLGLISSLLFTSCIGSFSAFNGLREWNESVTDSKFGNEMVFLALWIIPVYQLASFGDLIIFNTIEFWGGTNPIAMQEGDSEKEIVTSKKGTYAITATKNKFHIETLKGKQPGAILELVYESNDQSWSAIKEDGTKIKLTSLKKGFRMVHLPNGTSFEVNKSMNKQVTKTFVAEKISDYNRYNSAFAELD